MPRVIRFEDWTMTHADGKPCAAFDCPSCGNKVILDRTYKIGDTGIISPIVVCPYRKCDFNEHVRLEGYKL